MLLDNQIVQVYKKERDSKNVLRYPSTPTATIWINIQPIADVNWLESMWSYHGFKAYTKYYNINEGDMIIRDNEVGGQIIGATISNTWTWYHTNDVLTVVQSPASGWQISVNSVNTSWAIQTVSTIMNASTNWVWYFEGTNLSTTVVPAWGNWATVNITVWEKYIVKNTYDHKWLLDYYLKLEMVKSQWN